MKKLSMKNYVFAVGIAGFLAGSACVNLWMKEYIWDIGIFHEFFLEQYQQMDIRTEAYLWYLIKVRSIPLVGRLLCRYGIMHSDCQAAAKRNRSVSGRTGAARSAVCGRVSVVVPVYAGISTGPLADTKDCKISIDHECGYADGILCESGYRSHVFKIVIINESSVLMY